VTDADPVGVTFTNDPLRMDRADDAVVETVSCGVNVVAAFVLISALTTIGMVIVDADADV